ncbi:hypothetical protein V1460_33790 [Streptomyces sp. SCSIO 30461]|uniref:hypothetical protein n=1 Tax=Streptomyces sp. SCSIO 30461 TaxID=3118085 RepID=UPI0030CF7B72
MALIAGSRLGREYGSEVGASGCQSGYEPPRSIHSRHAGAMWELNGRPVEPDALQALGLTDYGHFTRMRVDNRRVRVLALRLRRLGRDCETISGTALDLDQVRHHIRNAVGDRAGILRLVVRPRVGAGLRADGFGRTAPGQSQPLRRKPR